MSVSKKLKKGLDIKILGEAENKLSQDLEVTHFGLKPTDFPGLTPKLNVKEGDLVTAGAPLFHDKLKPEILFTSPVSGKVTAIKRGDRRKLLEIVIEKSGDDFTDFGKSDPSTLSRDQIKEKLLQSGLWPALRQRPYHIVANPSQTPKSIFISGFDSAPLAPDYNFILENINTDLLKKGLTIVGKLTDGKVNMVLRGGGNNPEILEKSPGVDISYFSGPHPAGNVGVHIHHIDPINKGDIVWFIGLQDIISIGRLFAEGRYYPEKLVAVTGSEVVNPQYYRLLSGSSISPALNGNVKEGKLRYISGNVLTGTSVGYEGSLGYYDTQLTVIPEGNHSEFFGWMTPGLNKFSFSKTFVSKLFPGKRFRLDTNFNGGERAFVMTGQYEKVVPMDLYPMQLFKAILAEDIDQMENLGIYEIAEEDMALCEFICPSKVEIQSIVRKGLDLMMKEMN